MTDSNGDPDYSYRCNSYFIYFFLQICSLLRGGNAEQQKNTPKWNTFFFRKNDWLLGIRITYSYPYNTLTNFIVFFADMSVALWHCWTAKSPPKWNTIFLKWLIIGNPDLYLSLQQFDKFYSIFFCRYVVCCVVALLNAEVFESAIE